MKPKRYTALTGIAVDNEDLFKATSRRVRSQLELLLGFTLNRDLVSENLYNEQGISQRDCSYPNVDDGEYDGSLNPPEEVTNAYRLYKFNEFDKYFHVDPFTKLHRVKLVYIHGDVEVTLKTFPNVREQRERGWSKWIEKCKECLCVCECVSCVQLAVDADWLFEDCLPDDLMYIWADMITDEMQGSVKGIRRESITSHTVEYTDWQDAGGTGLFLTNTQYATLRKYAGPLGTVTTDNQVLVA